MNQIIIVGNGFDLAHGLPTRYSDFMLSFLKSCIRKAYSQIGKTIDIGPIQVRCRSRLTWDLELFLDKIESIEQMSENSWIYLNTQSNVPAIVFIGSDYNPPGYDKAISFSINSDLFHNMLSNHTKGRWIDIETEYFNLLNQILQRENKNDIREDLIELNDHLEFLKSEVLDYLREVKQKSRLTTLLKSNKEFASKLNRFLYPPHDNLSKEINGGSLERLVVNYNYTSTIDFYKDKTTSITTKVINIHGSFNDPDSEIIFGFGSVDSPELKRILTCGHKESSYNLKHMRYHVNGQNEELLRLIEKGPYLVRIVGHSCGASDGSTLRKLFEHKNCEQISICYLNEEEHFDKLYDIYYHMQHNYKELKIQPRNGLLQFPKLETSS